MRPGDPSAPRIGTKPAKNGTRTPTGSCDSPVSCWIRIAPRSRIALWTTNSSDVKSGSRADRSLKQSNPTTFAPWSTSQPAASGSQYGERM